MLWEPEDRVFIGSGSLVGWANKRITRGDRELDNPLAAVQTWALILR